MSALPKGWFEATLDDFCAFENGDRGKNYSGRSTFVASGVPFISAGHLNNGHIDWEEMNYIPQTNYDRLGSGKVKSGDFLFCLRGSLGKHAFVPKIDAAAIASSLVIVRPSQLTDCKFVDYYFRSPLVKSSIEVYSNGVAQPNLSSANLGRFGFPLPPLAEQKRIVAKLDALNAKSARARAELARIETLVSRYKQAVLSKAFSGELTRDWPLMPLGLLSKAVFDGPFGSNLKSADYTEDGPRVVRLENIGVREFIEEKRTHISEEKFRSLARHVLQANDLLFSSFVSEEIRACLFPANIDFQAINKADCFCIRLDTAKVDPQFALLQLTSEATYRHFVQQVHGATRPRINLSQLKNYPLLVPTLEEQHKIVRRIESALAKIDRLAKEAKRALELVGRLDEAILAKAFRGELVPQDENDEPAEHLLARIRAEREAAPKGRRGRGAKA